MSKMAEEYKNSETWVAWQKGGHCGTLTGQVV